VPAKWLTTVTLTKGMYLQSLTTGYDHPVCGPVTASLTPGEFVCLVGRNGSGKSTLLRTLAGLLPPLGGEIRIGDRLLQQMSPQELAHHLSVVLTHLPDLRHTTARQIAASGRLPYTDLVGHLGSSDYEAADQALLSIGIQSLADRLFHTLSDGEKQKVMLARALAQGTSYLLLDEPSAFLDYPSRKDLFSLLASLAHNGGKAVLLSTHDLEQAVSAADRIWYLHNGIFSIANPATFNFENI